MNTKFLSLWVLPILTLLSALAAHAAVTQWSVDPTHAVIGFSIDHMLVSEVEGKFNDYTATVGLDERDFTASKVAFTAKVASIDTDNEDRDKHLRGPDFFDVQKYPELHFEADSIRKSRDGYLLKGPLNMHGVTKVITLNATVSRVVKDPWGNQVRGVTIKGTVRRKDFGLSWNKALDQGGFALGDTVDIDIKLELKRPADSA